MMSILASKALHPTRPALAGHSRTVPTILVSAAAYEDYLLRKERVYETAVSMARTLVAELERELRGVESGLRILATSEELQQGKLGAFHRRLQDALQLQNVDGYVLLDNHDMLVANSSAPYPSPDQKRPAGRDPAAGPIAAGRRHEPVQHRPARRADHRRRDSGDPARPGPVQPVRRDGHSASARSCAGRRCRRDGSPPRWTRRR